MRLIIYQCSNFRSATLCLSSDHRISMLFQQTDANRFYYLLHAICYSYEADNYKTNMSSHLFSITAILRYSSMCENATTATSYKLKHILCEHFAGNGHFLGEMLPLVQKYQSQFAGIRMSYAQEFVYLVNLKYISMSTKLTETNN